MASIGLGFLGEPAVATLLEPLSAASEPRRAVAISVAIAYAARHVGARDRRRAGAEDHGDHPRRDGRDAGSHGRWSGSGSGSIPMIWALNAASNFVVKRILRIEVEGDLRGRERRGAAAC